jgi:hypothetical protein
MIAILVPATPGGIYDFGTLLARELNLRSRGGARLEVLRPGGLQKLAGTHVLLQCNAYGFHPRGVPFWLTRELQGTRHSFRSFGVYFHELYASGRPWQSSFWLNPFQKHIAASLARMADYRITNRHVAKLWLDERSKKRDTVALPVFSTIGEPESRPVKLECERSGIAVFGSAGVRARTYAAIGNRLVDISRQLKIDVHDIGAPIEDADIRRTLASAGASEHGQLDATATRDILAVCKYGLVDYPKAYVAKSSVFAAYCAFGLVPILLSEDHEIHDDLVCGKHYIGNAANMALDQPSLISIAAAATSWYSRHSLAIHARAVLSALETVEAY